MSDRFPAAADGPRAPAPGSSGGSTGFDRVPPHSLDAEVSVLGAAMLSANAASDVVQILTDDHFYRNAHRVVFEAIRSLQATGEPVDTVTVTDWLGRHDRLDEVGGPAAIHDLTVAVPTAANATHYARIVRQKALLRRLIEAGTEVARLGYESSDDADEVVDRAESIIYEVAQTGAQSEYARLGELLTESFEQIEQLAERGSEVTGLATGFNDLDRLTAGLQPQNLVIVAARPAMGKCLAAATEIVDVDGRRWTIRELVEQRPTDVRLLSFDTDSWLDLVPVAPSDFIANGHRPVWRLTTSSGRSLVATANHPFLTPDGWRELRDLQQGDEIARPAWLPVAASGDVAEADVRALAHMLATGEVGVPIGMDAATEPIGMDAATETMTPRAADAVEGSLLTRPRPRGGPAVTHGRRSKVAWQEWLNAFGITDAATLRVPQAIVGARPERVVLLLTRILSYAGRLEFSEEGDEIVVVRSPSTLLLRDMQHLLLRFGIDATLAVNDTGANLALRRFDVAVLAGIEGGDLDLADIAPIGERDLHGEIAVRYERIVAIESAGTDDVYDLTMPQFHNFVAGDLIVHNSSLALGISHYVTTRLHRPAILFSLEMSKIEIVNRLLSTEARIDSSRLRTGRLEESDWRKLGDALGSLADAPLYIDDTPSISLNEIRAKCRRLQQKQGLDLVIVDYLQLMQSHRRIESRQQEVAEISRGLKMLAKQLDVPVIALSQLSRQPESRTDKRPQLADLRESGSIEQDADIVGFIYRDEVYDEDSPDRGIAELIIAKHRNGATGVVRLAFLNHLTTFANLARGPATSAGPGGPGGAPGPTGQQPSSPVTPI